MATARGTYELTRGYLCACLILSVKGSDAEAGQAALMGVWAADDVAGRQGAEDGGATERPGEGEAVEAAREAATRCRRLAVAYLEADRKRGPTFAADEATAGALLAALHRRMGDFDAAHVQAWRAGRRGYCWRCFAARTPASRLVRRMSRRRQPGSNQSMRRGGIGLCNTSYVCLGCPKLIKSDNVGVKWSDDWARNESEALSFVATWETTRQCMFMCFARVKSLDAGTSSTSARWTNSLSPTGSRRR